MKFEENGLREEESGCVVAAGRFPRLRRPPQRLRFPKKNNHSQSTTTKQEPERQIIYQEIPDPKWLEFKPDYKPNQVPTNLTTKDVPVEQPKKNKKNKTKKNQNKDNSTVNNKKNKNKKNANLNNKKKH
ncbi:hypothetical protein OTU49_013633 [Cherax quadricarinatus]|uniref:Uncharacterized protein n=1 Tax=Cherax quadricarinatus TaxID=27406 RepID=A0AAW0VSB6_CHEQU